MRKEDVVSTLQPKCEVCTEPIPEERQRRNLSGTCSKECAEMLAAHYRYLRSRRTCLSCLRPSTPEQRAEWKKWRDHRGDRQGDQEEGRPAKKRETALATALSDSLDWLQELRDDEFRDNAVDGLVEDEEAKGRIRELDSLLEKIKKLVDVPVAA